MVSFGASNLLFTSVVADFTPAVFIPQGGETARAIGDYYQREGTLRQLRNRTTYRWAFKRLLDHVDEVWTGKPTIPVFERLGIDQKKIREVDFCSAIDTDTCYPREDSVEYGPGHPVIGTFRRPRGEKILENYRTFLDAIALLKNDGVNFHSVIGGLYEDSIHRSEIQKMVRDRDLTTHIELLPMVKKEEMPRYLSGLDIYVDIPYPDYDMVAIGTTSKEAMACGSAYITMDNSGSSKQWYTSNSEMLINENRPRELSNKMNSILGSDKIMTEVQNESIELVGNRYSITAIQKKFVNSCESVMNR
jgi:glycosyltransferase involved in cell wall biosynthesis